MTALEPAPFNVMFAVHVRAATQADLPKLEWYGRYTHLRRLFQRTFREQQADRRLMLVAECNNFPIGQLFIQFVRPGMYNGKGWGYLYALRVMDMFQGHGIGSRLIQAAEAVVIERGLEWTTIAVAKDNHAARRLYERLGYTVFSEDAGRWSYPDHEGHIWHMHEPCWLLQKWIGLR
jgi:GNAT superfamily N-acetyltransferase